MNTHFKQGSIKKIFQKPLSQNDFEGSAIKKIFQKPLSQNDFEGSAILVKCLRPFTEFHYGEGIIVEEWDVRLDNEKETYQRIVTLS